MTSAADESRDKAESYTRRLKRISALRVFVAALVLFFAASLSPYSLVRLFWRPSLWLWIILEWAAVFALISVLVLPLDLIQRRLQRAHGFSEHSLREWLLDWLKARLVFFAVVLAILLPALLLLGSGLPLAGLWAGAAAAMVYGLFVQAMPALILPWFFPTSGLNNECLLARLRDLARRTGVGEVEVSELRVSPKWKKANAMVAGLGKTRRILITDVLLSTCTGEEIESLIAHEFGHHKHHDMGKRLAIFSAGFVLGGLFMQWAGPVLFAGPDSGDYLYNVLGLFLLLIVPVGLSAIVLLRISRGQERAADLFAWQFGPSVEAFISALRKATDHNLITYGKKQEWRYSHPATAERIRAAEEYLKAQSPAARSASAPP